MITSPIFGITKVLLRLVEIFDRLYLIYISNGEMYYPRLVDMPIYGTSERYFRTAEACKAAGISKNTFRRWVKDGSFPDVKTRDRRGWRLFTKKEIAKLKAEANRVSRRN